MNKFLSRLFVQSKAILKASPTFENQGYCYACGNDVKFVARENWWRDHYLCTNCGSIPRERALMYCIEKMIPDWREKIIHESSPVFRGTSLRLKNEAKKYIATQYFPGERLGENHQGFRNENLEQLTFGDETIDIHISQDVFEHVFNPAKAFKEISRTLKTGGAHIFTTPLVNKNLPTELCAKLNSNGSIEYLLNPPEYHGNPVSSEGSLVTMHWGYDIVKYIYDACELFTEMFYIDALDLGIRAEYIEVLLTRKLV